MGGEQGKCDENKIRALRKKNEVLSIPPGYYNGFRALEEDSLLVVYSDASLEESSADDFRLSIETLPWGNV